MIANGSLVTANAVENPDCKLLDYVDAHLDSNFFFKYSGRFAVEGAVVGG